MERLEEVITEINTLIYKYPVPTGVVEDIFYRLQGNTDVQYAKQQLHYLKRVIAAKAKRDTTI